MRSCAAQAQPFPSRPLTLIVPFPPGGSTDAAARIMAERMRATLGQPVVIENVGGAGGSIGVGRLARSEPDGYTFDIGQWDTHVGSIIYKLDYDLEKDFAPIALVSNNPQLLVAKNDLPAKTLGELVTWMKENPGKINFVNQNAAANVTGVLFENLTGQKVTVHSLSRRRPGDDRSRRRHRGPSGGAGRGGAAADPRRQDQGARQSLAAALGLDA